MSDPAQPAQLLYMAWKANDRQDALRAAMPSAVDDLFSQPWQPPDWQFVGCSSFGNGYRCGFERGDVVIAMQVEGGASAGYHVDAIA